MGHKDKYVPRDLPSYGAIFMSNTGTKKECFQRKLFGLPLAQSDFVLHVKKGMILFLFEFERRQLYGVFRATSNGELNIQPNAYKSSGKYFPAQVRFTPVWNCDPLAEHEFKDAIRDNYFSMKKFKFGLSKDQVYKLISLFHSKRITPKNHPARNSLRYDDDKPAAGDSRFSDNRNNTRDRIRFKNKEHGHDFHEFLDDEVTKVDGFSTNYMTQNPDYGDHGTRQTILEEHLGRLRRVNDRNEMQNNLGELNETNNEIEDGYRQISVANNDIDNYRIQDDYHVTRTQRIDDGGYFGQETLETEQRTLTQHQDFDFEGVIPITHNSLPHSNQNTPEFIPIPESFNTFEHGFHNSTSCEPSLITLHTPITHKSLSHSNQNTPDFIPITESFNTFDHGFHNSKSCEPSLINLHTPYDPEVPSFCFRPSCFTAHSNSSPVTNRPFYPSSNDTPTSNSPSDTFPYHSQKKASVFDRLSLGSKALTREKEPKKIQEDEKNELDESVSKVMKMLEKIVRSPVNRSQKRQSTFEQDDDENITSEKIEDYEVLKMEFDEIEDGSVVEETRLVDFKRRKKGNKNLDDEIKESCKRRKLVRPVFVRKESAPLKADCYLRKEGDIEETAKAESFQVLEVDDMAEAGLSNEKRVADMAEVGLSNEKRVADTAEVGLSNEKHVADMVEVGLSNEKCVDDMAEVGLSNEKRIDDMVEVGLSNEKCVAGVAEVGLSNEKRGVDDVAEVGLSNEKRVDDMVEVGLSNEKCVAGVAEVGLSNEKRGVDDVAKVGLSNEKCVDDVAEVGLSNKEQKMCGWIEG